MSNKVYDWLKAICQVILPAVATVYWILSGVLGLLPYGEQVIGACVAIITCLGAILEYSSYKYEEDDNDGILDEGVSHSPDDDFYIGSPDCGDDGIYIDSPECNDDIFIGEAEDMEEGDE